MSYPTERFLIGGYGFTMAKNISGTGGYALCCQTPSPKFIQLVDSLAEAKTVAQSYVDAQVT